MLHERPASRADLPEIRAVVRIAAGEYGYAPEPEGVDADLFADAGAYFDDGGMLAVLVDDTGRVRGMVGVHGARRGAEAELRKIYLAREARGAGWGRRMLERALAFARERGARRIVLQTAARLTEAIALYERAGFRLEPGSGRSPTCDRRYALELDPE